MELTPAALTYQPTVSLQVDESKTFQVRIESLVNALPPQPGETQEKIGVACTIQARLVVASDSMSVDPQGWNEQEFAPSEARTWTWLVYGRDAGNQEAILQLRPVVRAMEPDGSVAIDNAGTREFPVTFVIEHSAQDVASSVWKFVVAAAGGTVTLIAAYFALKRLRGKERKPTVPSEDDTGDAA